MESRPNFADGFCTAGGCFVCTPSKNSPIGDSGAIKADRRESETCIKQVTKSPSRNVYVYLSHPPRAKIPQYVTDNITLFPPHTFWRNRDALNSTYAGLSPALLARDVDRSFWTIGRGGVGKSLFAILIDSALRHRRGFLDTDSLFRDGEIRKQIPLLQNQLDWEAQEAADGDIASETIRQYVYNNYERWENAGSTPIRSIAQVNRDARGEKGSNPTASCVSPTLLQIRPIAYIGGRV